jgi:glycosyltransferase involved in cell wall biosynthesis
MIQREETDEQHERSVCMNIVYHFRVRGVGAEAVHIAGIAGGFQHLGHRVAFVSPSGVNPLDGAPAVPIVPGRRAKLLNTLADNAPQLAFEAMEIGYNAVALPKLLRRIPQVGAGFLYERHAFFNAAGAIAAQRTGVPFVVEVNELAGYERVRDQKLVQVAKSFERFVFRHASLVVTVSDFLSDQVREMVGGRVPVVTIPNGVTREWIEWTEPGDQTEVLKAKFGLAGKRVICFVGALSAWHNFPLLLDALDRVRRAVPNTVLMVVGDGSEREAIEAASLHRGLREALCMVGSVSHADVRRYIALADAAVIPQSNQYRSPIKMFEYMGAGRPVVAPAVAPIESVIEDGRTGLLFNSSVEALAEALTRVLTDAALARGLGEAARSKITAEYTWDVHARRILELVELGSRARPNEKPGLQVAAE